MRYLIDTPPNRCPSCGKEFCNDTHNQQDFYAGASGECRCGAQWQHAPAGQLLELAKQHGDAGNYWS